MEKYDADQNIADTNDRQITTTANVPVGQTLVLGGILQKRHLRNKAGVPGLSRIPLFGKMFDRCDTVENEVELMVFLTPEVVDSGTQMEQGVDRAISSLDMENSVRKNLQDQVPHPTPEIREAAAEAESRLRPPAPIDGSTSVSLFRETASGPAPAPGPEIPSGRPLPARTDPALAPAATPTASPPAGIMNRFAELLERTRTRKKNLTQAH